VTLLIGDPADYAEINAEYVRHFPRGLPARHTARCGVPTAARVAFACIALAGSGDRRHARCSRGARPEPLTRRVIAGKTFLIGKIDTVKAT